MWLGDGAVRAPPTEKVAAAMATPQPEDEAERGQAEGGATASRPAKRQHAGGAKVQQQQQQGAGAAAAAGAPAGEAFKWGNRIAGWRIKCVRSGGLPCCDCPWMAASGFCSCTRMLPYLGTLGSTHIILPRLAPPLPACRVWWSDDSAFYPGRVTSYKQGCVVAVGAVWKTLFWKLWG